jgi:hypothetical protein
MKKPYQHPWTDRVINRWYFRHGAVGLALGLAIFFPVVIGHKVNKKIYRRLRK